MMQPKKKKVSVPDLARAIKAARRNTVKEALRLLSGAERALKSNHPEDAVVAAANAADAVTVILRLLPDPEP